MKKLTRNFYLENTLSVAKALLGKLIVRVDNDIRLSAMIVETEGYLGKMDLACHSYKGRTKRSEVMFGEGGYVYIYLIYGMYNLFNIVTRSKAFPECVLIRAVEPIDGIEKMKTNVNSNTPFVKLTNGPGKLTRALGITREYYGHDLTDNNLFMEEYKNICLSDIVVSKRVGIDYAKGWQDKKFRYHIKDNLFVSFK